MQPTHHVYLIPGFFGFVNFGRLVYFSHVREFLEEAFERLGVRVDIHRARVSPTASLRGRAREVVEFVAGTAGEGPIHLIGHSSGGLDARLVVTPGVDLGTPIDVEGIAGRVRSVVTVATPHRGTPLASLFSGVVGQRLLWLLSLGTVEVLRSGRLPLSVLVRVAGVLARVPLRGGKAVALLDQLYDELVGELPPDQRGPVADFLHRMRADQSLIPQLTPEGADVFNAATADRSTVRYGCVMARGRRPEIAGRIAAGLGAYPQASYTLFAWLYRAASRLPARSVPSLEPRQAEALLNALERPTHRRDNDGIVPTLSQVWGEVVHAARADHLDVIGHFHDPAHEPPHVDWLFSGSDFDRAAFEHLWMRVAAFVAGA